MTDDSYRQIYIQNIPYDIAEADLSDWCNTFGEITKCKIIYDSDGKSRGFAFVTFASIDGHNNFLSQGPHSCKGRPLTVRTAESDRASSSENQFNSSSDHLSQTISSTNEISNSTTMDTSLMYDDDNHNRLASLRDELDANLECMQIAHEHELKLLRDKLTREKKLCKEAEELYKEAEEDWHKMNEENIRLRTSLIKNVVQTFNIRRNFARQTKEQLKKCTQFEKQCNDIR